MNRLIVFVLALLPLASAHARTASTPVAGQPKDNLVLYLDSAGNPYTFVATPDSDGKTILSSRRSVSIDEVIRLEDLGFNIVYFDDQSRQISAMATYSTDAIPPQLPSLPSNFSIVQLSNVVYGNFWVAGTRPPNTATQYVNYRYYSSNMSTFGSHMFVILLSDTSQLTTNSPPTYAPALVGNGVEIGNVGGTPNGCGNGTNHTPFYNMEVESFWNGGNKLYSNTCSPAGLADLTYYQVGIQANTAGYVAYTVSGGMTWNSPAPNTIPDRPVTPPGAGNLNGGGLIFALIGTPDPDYTRMQFTNAVTGWF